MRRMTLQGFFKKGIDMNIISKLSELLVKLLDFLFLTDIGLCILTTIPLVGLIIFGILFEPALAYCFGGALLCVVPISLAFAFIEGLYK